MFTKKLFSLRWVFACVALVLLMTAWIYPAVSGERYNDGELRAFNKSISAWTVPAVPVISGATFWTVDLTESSVVYLATKDLTSGATIYFKGTNQVPTVTKIVIPGNGQQIWAAEGSNSQIEYMNDGGWPFPQTTNAARTYILEVMSGIGVNAAGDSGTTVYILSGVTVWD